MTNRFALEGKVQRMFQSIRPTYSELYEAKDGSTLWHV
jgi:hypothetical protein